MISGKNGGARGQYHDRSGRLASLPPLHLEPEQVDVDLYQGSLLEHFERWDALYRQMAELDGEVLWLTYEDHIEADPLVAYRLCEEHLGLVPHQPLVRLRRTNPEPLERAPREPGGDPRVPPATPYEWMIDEE